ncbi:hypothetical protein [Flexibacterium corallicola]|uniref:hypothetical protein n=1 Tax=Flexibacterium corallicola TaxID=3037259 RepID=UPI00286F86B8|nr:hypothetical protein [Pseudovibrio sp. M1P-2-3]
MEVSTLRAGFFDHNRRLTRLPYFGHSILIGLTALILSLGGLTVFALNQGRIISVGPSQDALTLSFYMFSALFLIVSTVKIMQRLNDLKKDKRWAFVYTAIFSVPLYTLSIGGISSVTTDFIGLVAMLYLTFAPSRYRTADEA